MSDHKNSDIIVIGLGIIALIAIILLLVILL